MEGFWSMRNRRIMKVLLAHPGTQHSPVLARELDQRSLLGEFNCGFGLQHQCWLAKISTALPKIPGMRILRNRIVIDVDNLRIRTNACNEFYAHWRIRQGDNPVKVIHRRNRLFQENIQLASVQSADAIIGFDTSSWILAQQARRLGIPFWLERTTDHPTNWAGMQLELHQRYPEWQDMPIPRLAELVAAEEVEHDMAYRILVGSSFVARSLANFGVDGSKVVVNPYGVSWGTFNLSETFHESPAKSSGPVRFLFAGNIGARKGIPVLLEAWKQLGWRKGEAELWLVGTIQDRHRRLIPASENIRLIGRVAKADMASIYAQCDIFVLPSLSEGFGLVLLEALAAGLPVITTSNTGGPDLQDDGAADCVTVVEAGSTEELAEAMRTWKDCPPGPDRINIACDKLRSRYSWEAYGDRWEDLLNEPLTSY